MNEVQEIVLARYGSVSIRRLGIIETQKAREKHYIEAAIASIKVAGEVAYPGDTALQARHLRDGLLALPKGPAMQRELEQQQLDDLYLARLIGISIGKTMAQALEILEAATESEVLEILRALTGGEKKTSPLAQQPLPMSPETSTGVQKS